MSQNKSPLRKARADLGVYFKRVTVKIKKDINPDDKNTAIDSFNANVVLNDITKKGLSLFSKENIPTGQEVFITFNLIEEKTVRAKVLTGYSMDFDTHVITDRDFSHRIIVMFLYISQKEKAEFEAYLDKIQNEYVTKGAKNIDCIIKSEDENSAKEADKEAIKEDSGEDSGETNSKDESHVEGAEETTDAQGGEGDSDNKASDESDDEAKTETDETAQAA